MNKVIDIDERKAAASVVDRAVRLLLVDRRLKMGDVADRTGIPLPTLYGKLRGGGPLELHEVRRLAQAFDLSITDFIRVGESTTRQWAARDSNPEPAGSGVDDQASAAA